jgi:uncharacterized protein
VTALLKSALALLGFMYEHGFGAPQAYDAAADLYTQGAVQGDPFAQTMLALMYDKGHGVPQNFVLAYKWLDLAAARTRGHEREAYARFRDAVASKMSTNEIVEGQRLALNWTPTVRVPRCASLARLAALRRTLVPAGFMGRISSVCPARRRH